MQVTNFNNYGTYNEVESGATQINNYYGIKGPEQGLEVALPVLVACVENVRKFLWKDSAMAVIFCVCRDCYCYADNMSQFERDFQCQEGLVSNTFRNNPYMRLHVDKWKEMHLFFMPIFALSK